MSDFIKRFQSSPSYSKMFIQWNTKSWVWRAVLSRSPSSFVQPWDRLDRCSEDLRYRCIPSENCLQLPGMCRCRSLRYKFGAQISGATRCHMYNIQHLYRTTTRLLSTLLTTVKNPFKAVEVVNYMT